MEEVAPCDVQLFSLSSLNSSPVPSRVAVAGGATASPKLAKDGIAMNDSVRAWRCELRPDVPISWVTALVVAAARAVGAGGAPGTITNTNTETIEKVGKRISNVDDCELPCITSGAARAALALNAAGGASFGGGLTYSPNEHSDRAETLGAKNCSSGAGLLHRQHNVPDARKEATVSAAAMNAVTFCPGLLVVTECQNTIATARAGVVHNGTTTKSNALIGRVVVMRADPIVSIYTCSVLQPHASLPYALPPQPPLSLHI